MPELISLQTTHADTSKDTTNTVKVTITPTYLIVLYGERKLQGFNLKGIILDGVLVAD